MSDKRTKSDLFFWHVALLCSLTISQPLLSVFGSQPEFLLAHRMAGLDLVIWILAVSFLPALVAIAAIALLERIFRSHQGFVRSTSLLLAFFFCFFVYLVRLFEASSWTAGVGALSLSLLSLYVYRKFEFARSFLSIATVLMLSLIHI